MSSSKRYFKPVGGRFVEVTEDQFWGTQTPAPRGLGDIVAAVATPIARALGLPCIDPATKQLRPESKCAQRKAALNHIVPKI